MAKENLTYREYVSWVRYRSIRGSLSPTRRLEQALARVCHLITVAAGIKKDSDSKSGFTIADFMPHEDGFAELNTEITLDDFIKSRVFNNGEK